MLQSFVFFFFFKQKTAYEIYQCDWSSDVCSSDLHGLLPIIGFSLDDAVKIKVFNFIFGLIIGVGLLRDRKSVV